MALETAEKIWMNGDLVDWDDATVHVLTHTLHYGNGVFEGIRAYETDTGPAVFQLRPHIERLFQSAKILYIDIPWTVDQLVEGVLDTVRVNGFSSCYIRPLVYLGYGEMGLNPLDCKVEVSISCWPWGAYLGDESLEKGVRLMISSWQRHDPNAMPPAAKGVGHYVNSQMAKVQAIKSGYEEAILLSPQGYVSECTGENLFIVREGKIITPPSSAGALEGITQKTVRKIAEDLDIPYIQGNILRSDLYIAEEAFLSGTAAEIVPIRSVDDREIGDRGPITKAIQEVYFDVVRGKRPEYESWNEYVNP
ncbi:MAG: branched-chain amino acid aminotransferase [marine actinobacterium MedAcidi-G2B]|nr:MAG: branched-chain amino acid aminotransferase [marine actinobacterium MedAcidi-G2B]|tara:strand:+ start:637 stop:1557 length:921 start_codon:yes stop_codon:yes gene_type:complete